MRHLINAMFCAVCLSVLLFSCDNKSDKKDDPPGPSAEPSTLVVAVVPVYEGTPLDFEQTYVNVHNYRFQVQDVAFYAANINLIKEDGSSLFLSEIEFFDLASGRDTVHFSVPAGSYMGIQFDIGVPVELNGTEDPNFNTAIYDQSSPLSTFNGMYWSWANGYRFFTFAGRYDTLSAPQEVLPFGFAFHSGMDTLYREIPPLDHAFSVSSGSVTELPIQLHIERLFANAQDTIDLKVENTFHGSEAALPTGIKFANHTATCFTLE